MQSIDIANLALVRIGMTPICDFDDSAKGAVQCKRFFPVVRDRVLRDHHWSFAAKHCDLAELEIEAPDRGFEFCCALPGDVIRVIGLESLHRYRIFGSNILVNALPERLFYTARIINAEFFDPLFCEALEYMLASELVMANTREGDMVNYFRQEYERRLMTARSVDSMENIHACQRQPRRSSFLAARRGATGIPGNTGEPVNFVEGDAGVQ